MSPIIESRIAVLESQGKERDKDILQVYRDIRDHMEREEADREVWITQLNDLRQNQNDMNIQMTKYKGMVGGFVLALTCIASAAGLAWKYLIS